jgi:hypothetical protein
MTIVQAVAAFGSFDHGLCFEHIRSSHTNLQYVFGWHRSVHADFQVVKNGFIALLLDLFAIVMIAASVRLWMLPAAVVAARYERVQRMSPSLQAYASPRMAYLVTVFVLIIGAGYTLGWIAGTVEYVTTCRALLGVS